MADTPEQIRALVAEAMKAAERESWDGDKNYAALFHNLARALEALAERVPEGWQTMESAPRDGTWILAYWPTMPMTTYPRVVFWDDGWICTDRDMGEYFPTAWMPLPAAPQPPALGAPGWVEKVRTLATEALAHIDRRESSADTAIKIECLLALLPKSSSGEGEG